MEGPIVTASLPQVDSKGLNKKRQVKFDIRKEYIPTKLQRSNTCIRKQIVKVDTDTNLENFTTISVLRRSVSCIDVCSTIYLTKENFQKFLQENDNRNPHRSMDNLHKPLDWGRISEKERRILLTMEQKIVKFLRKHRYWPSPRHFLSEVMTTIDHFFHILEFMCIKAPRNLLPFGMQNEILFKKLGRGDMINLAVRLGAEVLKLKKSIRRTDLLNPVALCSKNRAVHFLYELSVYIESAWKLNQ